MGIDGSSRGVFSVADAFDAEDGDGVAEVTVSDDTGGSDEEG